MRVVRTGLVVVLVAMVAVGCSRSAPASGATDPATQSAPAASPTPANDVTPSTALGQFRSAIKAASPGQWSVLETTVLAASDRGAWDDYSVGSPVLMTDGSSGYRMWFIGCRLARDQYDCAIGHATSKDGIDWTRDDSPVFVPPGLPTPHWLGALAIVKTADGYQMWYALDGDRFADRALGTLHMATSADGLTWQNVGLVHTATGRRTIRHAVHRDGQAFHLWYADATEDGSESFLHLTSGDGRTWKAAGGDTLGGRADSVGRPWVTSDGRGGFRALIVDSSAAPAVKWFVSADGTTWMPGDVELNARVAQDGTAILDGYGLQVPEGLWLWTTTATPSRLDESISVTFKKGSGS